MLGSFSPAHFLSWRTVVEVAGTGRDRGTRSGKSVSLATKRNCCCRTSRTRSHSFSCAVSHAPCAAPPPSPPHPLTSAPGLASLSPRSVMRPRVLLRATHCGLGYAPGSTRLWAGLRRRHKPRIPEQTREAGEPHEEAKRTGRGVSERSFPLQRIHNFPLLARARAAQCPVPHLGCTDGVPPMAQLLFVRMIASSSVVAAHILIPFPTYYSLRFVLSPEVSCTATSRPIRWISSST